MEEDAPAELLPVEDRPSSAADTVAFVEAVERELYTGVSVAFSGLVIEAQLDGNEVHSAAATAFERELRGTEKV